MGVIYLLTSPSGNKYVGKTKKTFAIRMNRHRYDSENYIDKCPKLYNAIRLHGWDNFTKQVIYECPDDMLNVMEIMSIASYDYMHPGGYNLTLGGDGNGSPHTQEFKDEKSKQMQKHGKEENLPTYVKPVVTKCGSEGYCVDRPDKPYAQWCSPKLTMDQKKAMAIEHNRKIMAGIEDDEHRYQQIDLGFKRLPGISYISSFDGFYVKKPGHPTRYFKAKKETRMQKYEKAEKYLNSLNP
jgi:group I intron endonuclease